MSLERRGIAAGGNWIVDWVKQVDCIAARGMLANILSEQRSTGGAPANVLADLARMRIDLPLWGIGRVGDDPNGRYVLETFRSLGVNVDYLHVTGAAPTSYTDVVNVDKSGDRAFYHHRGANALFEPADVPAESLPCRLFHLGYILLLDRLDQPDPEFGSVAGRLLARVQQAGILTSVDVVSEEGDRFKTFVPPVLKYVDYLILNEIEAGRTVGVSVRNAGGKLDGAALAGAVERLFALGRMRLVAVHMPEGVYVRTKEGRRYSAGALALPDGYIAGAVGAGDAFCAGMLYGLHESWTLEKTVYLASCCAAASLSQPGATGGLRPLADVLAIGQLYPEGAAPVKC
jgi:sugar/nucleoside kinase (ribokinase family)